MQHETQRSIAPAWHELLSTVSALRNDILAESEELFHSWQSRIERHEFVPSAQNLAAYLASRFAGAAGITHALGAVVAWPQRVACHRHARGSGRTAQLSMRGNAHGRAGLP